MAHTRNRNKQLVLFAVLCLIILLSAVIINKFNNNGPADPDFTGGADESFRESRSDSENAEDSIEGANALSDLNLDPEMLILVNKQNELPKDFSPADLSRIDAFAPGRDDAARYMRTEAAEQLNALLDDAMKEGFEIVITTAYRSYGLQKIIFDNNVKRKGSVEEANKTSAKPGQSEHQTGLAADLTTPGLNYEISYGFGTSDEGLWMARHAAGYGFVMRYPEGKEDITGYTYEPWHYRYVGKDAAGYIVQHGLTLEEFIVLLDQ